MTEAKSTGKNTRVEATVPILKAARVALGLDQADLAQDAGLTRETISNLESAKRPTSEDTRARVQLALEARGIVFTNGDRPGFNMPRR